MLLAEKGNKVKEINESQIEACVQQGYRIVNERGQVIQETVPTDLATLKLAYRQNAETIKALKIDNQSLKAENDSLRATIASLEKELDEAKASSVKASSQSAVASKAKSKKGEAKTEE